MLSVLLHLVVSATDCSTLSSTQCADTPGCYWSAVTNTCLVTEPTACTSLPHSTCLLRIDCDWTWRGCDVHDAIGPTNCSLLVNGTSCGGKNCTWLGIECVDSNTTCRNRSYSTCEKSRDCEWNDTSNLCTVVDNVCAFNSYLPCDANTACTWTFPNCSMSHVSNETCSPLMNGTSCGDARCTWLGQECVNSNKTCGVLPYDVCLNSADCEWSDDVNLCIVVDNVCASNTMSQCEKSSACTWTWPNCEMRNTSADTNCSTLSSGSSCGGADCTWLGIECVDSNTTCRNMSYSSCEKSRDCEWNDTSNLCTVVDNVCAFNSYLPCDANTACTWTFPNCSMSHVSNETCSPLMNGTSCGDARCTWLGQECVNSNKTCGILPYDVCLNSADCEWSDDVNLCIVVDNVCASNTMSQCEKSSACTWTWPNCEMRNTSADTNCSTLSSGSSCGGADCTWLGIECVDSNTTCRNMSYSSCEKSRDCEWNDTSNLCTVVDNVCAFNSYLPCDANTACTWTFPNCSMSHVSNETCSPLMNGTSCGDARCTWLGQECVNSNKTCGVLPYDVCLNSADCEWSDDVNLCIVVDNVCASNTMSQCEKSSACTWTWPNCEMRNTSADTNCSTLSSGSSCGGADCTWLGIECVDSNTTCRNMSYSSCEKSRDCEWNDTSNLCTVVDNVCAFNSYLPCDANTACTWTFPNCSMSHVSNETCSPLMNGTSCGDARCTWLGQECVNSNKTCGVLPYDVCLNSADCEWSDDVNLCIVVDNVCASNTMSQCEKSSACTWTWPNCEMRNTSADTNCSTLSSGSSCGGADCTWLGIECVDSNTTCRNMSYSSCEKSRDCEWNDTSNLCTVVDNVCAFNSYLPCDANTACTWTFPNCSMSHVSNETCSPLMNGTSCGDARCTWLGQECVNSNTTCGKLSYSLCVDTGACVWADSINLCVVMSSDAHVLANGGVLRGDASEVSDCASFSQLRCASEWCRWNGDSCEPVSHDAGSTWLLPFVAVAVGLTTMLVGAALLTKKARLIAAPLVDVEAASNIQGSTPRVYRETSSLLR